MISLLDKSSVRYLLRHPWQSMLTVLGIIIGVAVIVAIDIANTSSMKAFGISMDNVTGKATHSVSSSNGLIDDSLYFSLRSQYPDISFAPVIEKNVAVEEDSSRVKAMFLGLDPFSEGPFRNLFDVSGAVRGNEITALLQNPMSVLITKSLSDELGIKANDSLAFTSDGVKRKALVAAVTETENEKKGNIKEYLILTDIANAQKISGIYGKISAIDLIAESDSPALLQLEKSLPAGTEIVNAGMRGDATKSMTEAFELNLTAMSLLALIVGIFLIFNTISFSVIRRKKNYGLSRVIGVTGKQLFGTIIFESMLLAFTGSVIGIFAGIAAGREVVNLVTATLGDLYFATSVKAVSISSFTIIKGFSAGIFSALIAASIPAYGVYKDTPAATLRRSSAENPVRNRPAKFAVISLLSSAAGAGILLLPESGIYLSYTGILFIIIAFSFTTPFVLKYLVGGVLKIIPDGRHFVIKSAVSSVRANMSRTVFAVAALAVAVSATIGVYTMIGSFRGTVVKWLEQTLQADVFISSPSLVARKNDPVMPESLLAQIKEIKGVNTLDFYSDLEVLQDGKIVHIIGASIDPSNYRRFSFTSGNPDEIWKDYREHKGVLVTETFAYKNNIGRGDSVTITGNSGPERMRVSGVYYDYSSDNGHIAADFALFRKMFADVKISGIGVYLKKDADAEIVKSELNRLNSPVELLIRSNNELRNFSIDIFDRTFIVARSLQILSVLVAFIGIFSALMSLQLEKGREFAVMRSVGLTPGNLFYSVSVQTAFMGLAAGLLSVPLGNVLAYLLINVINKRSFGWSLQFEFSPEIILQALIVSVVSAVLAGIYPAYKMSRTNTAVLLREE
ncbi:MAG: FtsX-like permease family protein [Ignavibacteriaceae bacterium]|nr:FtsX-like permease family protein [Ignavibacteriaceae bacterium]